MVVLSPSYALESPRNLFFFFKRGPHIVLPGLNAIGSQGHAICLSAQHRLKLLILLPSTSQH